MAFMTSDKASPASEVFRKGPRGESAALFLFAGNFVCDTAHGTSPQTHLPRARCRRQLWLERFHHRGQFAFDSVKGRVEFSKAVVFGRINIETSQ
jgi:hypothetical protein